MPATFAKVHGFDRGVRCAQMLYAGRALTVQLLMEEFEYSSAAAYRDLLAIETMLPVRLSKGPPTRPGRASKMLQLLERKHA
jgi:predicted DNA-binding transcriptional regulator YafY